MAGVKKVAVPAREKTSGNNDMRKMKLEIMFKEIAKLGYALNCCYLGFIYDYDSLNDYGKVIMEQNYEDIDFLYELSDDWELKKDEIEGLINECKGINGSAISSKFIFWALMVLTVDDTNKEEHLSLICDFARILKVSDEEMMDIVQVIQMIYNKAEDKIEFQTKLVPYNFGSLLSDIGYETKDLDIADRMLSVTSALLGGRKRAISEIGEEIKRWEKKAH